MYNSKNAKEIEGLKADTVFNGIVVHIDDGKVKDFVKDTTNWKGDIENKAINVIIELSEKGSVHRFGRVFTYCEENGETTYKTNSNLGKYKKKYGNLPKVEDKVKCLTNGEGFPSLTIE